MNRYVSDIPADVLTEANKVLRELSLKEATRDEAGIAALIVEAARRWPDMSFQLIKETSFYDSETAGRGITTRWSVERKRRERAPENSY